MKKNKRKEISADGVDSPKYLSAKQLANRWGISVSALYMMCCGSSSLTRFRFGRTIRFSLEEVKKFETELN
jgi:hypothetical protein